jgi:hypothetical protein
LLGKQGDGFSQELENTKSAGQKVNSGETISVLVMIWIRRVLTASGE